MEKSTKTKTEITSPLNDERIKLVSNKEKVANKIENLWSNKSAHERNNKYGTKKLIIKLETLGKEKKRISLKLESSNTDVNSNNYHLLSELLKEFFNVNHNQ